MGSLASEEDCDWVRPGGSDPLGSGRAKGHQQRRPPPAPPTQGSSLRSFSAALCWTMRKMWKKTSCLSSVFLKYTLSNISRM